MKHARRRVESEESFGLRDILIWCGIPIVIVLLVRMFLFGFYVIPSGSMLNTIEPGDRVVTSKLTPKVFKLQRGARQAGHGQRCGHRRNFVHPLRRGPQLLRVQ